MDKWQPFAQPVATLVLAGAVVFLGFQQKQASPGSAGGISIPRVTVRIHFDDVDDPAVYVSNWCEFLAQFFNRWALNPIVIMFCILVFDLLTSLNSFA